MAARAPPLDFHPATPERWPDLEALFGENGACDGCWCQFWKQSPAEYRAGRGEANRRALRRSVKRGERPGLLAYAGGEPVGWVAVEPRARYRRLAISRNLPVVDERPTWSIPCFFVARGWRGKGVSARLLEAAVAWARRRGAPAVEGYPVDSQARLASAWLYTGAFSSFVAAGFTEVARRVRTRPVMKREMGRLRGGRARPMVGRKP